MFRRAVSIDLIQRNPFSQEQITVTVKSNKDREHYVPLAHAEKIIKSCFSDDWRLIFALTRYAGLRCPTEVLALRWRDINWEEN